MAKVKALDKLKKWARAIKQNLFVLYLASRDPRVPWYVKGLAICVVAYAFSPIDLIPDFIPVLGYLDDLILVPAGISLALKGIPRHVIEDCREKADDMKKNGKPKNWIAASLFVIVWILLAVWIGTLLF